jgi:hypothetical protein
VVIQQPCNPNSNGQEVFQGMIEHFNYDDENTQPMNPLDSLYYYSNDDEGALAFLWITQYFSDDNTQGCSIM